MNLITRVGRRGFGLVAGGLIVGLAATACGTGQGASGSSAEPDLKITVISGPLVDPFFSAMKKGTEQAAKDLGVTVEWTAPKDLSNVGPDLARLGDAALAGKPDGVVLSYFLPDAQLPSLKKMIAGNIPVTFMNSGPGWEEIGGLNYVGEDPTIVGTEVGRRLAGSGKKNVVCVNHAPGVDALQRRCDALEAVLDDHGATMKQVNIPLTQGTNPTAVSNAIAGALRVDPSIDAVFTLGSTVAENAARVIDKAGSDAMLVTTDLSTNVLDLIKKGEIAFASDQQPWLTGYYSVETLVHYLRFRMHPIGAIDTAPNWITRDNADDVLRLNKEFGGVRGAA